LEKLKINNGNTAPWICDTLVYNNYDDWYLSSLDELLMTYTNIRNNRNGGFKPIQYWSSSCYPNGSTYPGAAYFVDFSNGQVGLGYDNGRVRACRRF
jgi:hypothetical protein